MVKVMRWCFISKVGFQSRNGQVMKALTWIWRSKNLVFQALITFFAIIFQGCSPTGIERNILLVTSSSESPSEWLQVLQKDLSDHFDIVQLGTTQALDDDSLRIFGLIYLYELSVAELGPGHLNALDRYLLAGGHCVWVGGKGTHKDRYRSRILGPLIADSSFYSSTDSVQFEILHFDGPDSLEKSKAVCQMSIDHFERVDYEKVSIPERPDEYKFVVDTLCSGMNEPIEFEVLPSLDVLVVERGGKVGLLKHGADAMLDLVHLNVIDTESNGLNGIALAPDFDVSGQVYFSYLPAGQPSYQRVSRMILYEDFLDTLSEEIIMEIPIEYKYGWHGTNAIEFDSKGNLYIGLGDFTLQSSEIAGYAQIDERPGYQQHDAQRTSANSHNYPGKILRIRPLAQGGYEVPTDNLFGDDSDTTRSEIYVMGCRNPYRFTIDPYTGALYFGDVGPDAWDDGEKGPRGYDELNVVRQAGFYGWPYFVADNKPYLDYDYQTKILGAPYDPKNLTNTSPNNTGIRRLPPARKPILWYHKGNTDEFPYLGMGGMNIMVGPRYYYRDYVDQSSPFPSYFDEQLFIYDWVRNWILLISTTTNDTLAQVEPFLPQHPFNKIMDMKFGSDGALYILEYGSEGYRANENAAIKRIRYVAENPRPPSFEEFTDGGNLFHNILPEKAGVEQGRYLITTGICLSCHHINQKIVGPSFVEISDRYPSYEESLRYLSRKIIDGGSGNWPGNIIMPANSDVTVNQAEQMVKYILSF